MAEIQQTQRGERNRTRQKKVQLRVDFTPMVDMNMLLITFFMLATTMIKPQSMKITMPAKEGANTEVPKSKAVTVYLGKNHHVYYFQGEPDLKQSNYLTRTDFASTGLRKVLLDKNAEIVTQVEELKQLKANLQISKENFEKEVSKLKENSPIVMIKPLDNSTYNDMVSALDEMLITNIGKYVVAKLDEKDKIMLKNSMVEF
ncbi:conserved hypothetical protein [uncultured Paludibacter sp.]|nr:conserved hypothetical protein [uncultured Paludibacter sp.]